MPPIISRTAWLSLLLVALLAVSTVNAHPIRQTAEMENALEVRSPRLIPDTEEYVRTILQGFGLEAPTPTSTPTPTVTPTASIKTNQDLENMEPTQTTHSIYSSPISYTSTYGSNEAGYTQTVEHKHSDNEPVESAQVGDGWNGGKQVEDFTKLFKSIYELLEHRLKDMINSSDEIGLENFV
ncbi:hypothetical protein N7517_000971 [Penicillium concentricum]|uniref:Uncharacterized protein n=1 Tax=Penicillium concentricum TaxID=293559 RepID=A0A9W9SR56_9EURO|nr:uncharacterized protein N7517_000971 [Penicillium concentricum]KAJ5383060.1 hypothetical protein N7517_000971 [Penicillium concentricum]